MSGSSFTAKTLHRVVALAIVVVLAAAGSLVAQAPATVEAAWPPATTPKLYIYATRVGDASGERVTDVLSGENNIQLNWNIPSAQSCTVSAHGFALFGANSGPGYVSTYGNITSDTTYTLTCTFPSGATYSGATTVRVVPVRADNQLVRNGGQTWIRWNVPNPSPGCTYVLRANGFDLGAGAASAIYTGWYAAGGMGANTQYSLVCRPSSGPDVPVGSVTVLVPTAVPAQTFLGSKGGSVFQGDYWFNDAVPLIPRVKQLGLNVVRLPVNLSDAVLRGTEADLVSKLAVTLDALQANGIRAIVLMGSYTSYEWSDNPYCTNASYPTTAGGPGLQLPYVEVATLASQIVAALNNKPALMAYEVQNEVGELPPNGAPVVCDQESKVGAVQAMYRLIKSIDTDVPTTVAEAWAWWNLPRWNPISSFLSYHEYSIAQGAGLPVGSATAAQYAAAQVGNVLTDINALRSNPSVTVPVVLGEWGHSNAIGEPVALTNASFTGGNIAGWSKTGTTTIASDPSGYFGYSNRGGSLRARKTGTATASVYTDVSSPRQSAFKASVWVRSSDGSAVSGSVALWSLGSSNQVATMPFTVSGPSWKEVVVTFDPTVADALAANSMMRFEVYLTTANKNLLIDEVRVWRGINSAGLGEIYRAMYCSMKANNVSSYFWALSAFADVYNPYSPSGALRPSGAAIQRVYGPNPGC